MFKRLFSVLDARTDYRALLLPLRRRVVPGGPSWALSTATCILWLLVIEVVTGLLLMSSYSPSVTDAWASVHYIEQTAAGSFIRGLHYFAAQAMIILFGLHTIRVLIAGAFRAPHELVWISGLLLIPLMIIWAITGNPLSGSQKGFSQIEVEGNIIASTPVIGPVIQRLLIGGDEVGNLTLTHLYTMHVAVMPLLVGTLLFLHLSQIYKHGLSASYAPTRAGATRPYWPYQSVRNMVFFGVVLGVVACLAWKVKAPFDAPADPNLPHSPRPEWYFLFLFELRRYFVGSAEPIATIVLPGVTLLLLLAIPFLDRILPQRLNKILHVVLVLIGVAAFAGLTAASVWRDRYDERHQQAHRDEVRFAKRARELADRQGIPLEGAITLLRNDPETQGPLLFQQHCAACHPHVDAEGAGIAVEKPSAPNLYGFAAPEWIAGFLDPEQIVSAHYLGGTSKANGEMVGAIRDAFDAVEDADSRKALQANMRLAAIALSAEAKLPTTTDAQTLDPAEVARGVELLTGDLACTDCHKFHDQGDLGSAPDLTGFGSDQWLTAIIANIEDDRFYGGAGNDRMPAYAKNPHAPEQNLLSPQELGLLVRWLRRDTAGAASPTAPTQPAPPASSAPSADSAAPAAGTAPENAPPATPPAATPEATAPAVTDARFSSPGAKVFQRSCARCHAYLDRSGQGFDGATPNADGKPNGAPNLFGFASREWLAGLLHPQQIVEPHYFGNTAFREGEMVEWTKDNLGELDETKRIALNQLIAALSAEAALPSQAALDEAARSDNTLEAGRQALVQTLACTDCHKFHDNGDLGSAPDLTGYGSPEWLKGIISNPGHERFYRDTNDRMPAFAENPDKPEENRLPPADLELLVRFLRGEE